MKKFVSALAVLTLVFSASNLFAQGIGGAVIADAPATAEAAVVAEPEAPAAVETAVVAEPDADVASAAEAAPAPCAPVAAPSCQPACVPVKKCLQLRRRFAFRCCAPCAPCAPAAKPCDCEPACTTGPTTVCVSSGYVPACIPQVRCPNDHPCLSPATLCLPCGSCNPCDNLVAPGCKAPVAPCAPACN